MKSDLPTTDDIIRAAERIAGQALRTPLLSDPGLDARTGGRILLKAENLQRTGSFKFRGAYNAIAALSPEERAKGIVAVSSGNHAQGVAEAARLLGLRATIVMPADAPAMKRERTLRSGAHIVDYDRAHEDRDAIARELIARHGGSLIHPYNDANVISGQGTIGAEIATEMQSRDARLDAVVIPCGGGGLSAGIGIAVRAAFPKAELILVEPLHFDDYARSLAAGHIVANAATAGSVVDALLAPSPGKIGFAVNLRNEAHAVAVSDEEALAAVAYAFRELKLVLEPAGAVGLAALITAKIDARGRTVAVVLSGGNIDEAMLARALAMPRSSR